MPVHKEEIKNLNLKRQKLLTILCNYVILCITGLWQGFQKSSVFCISVFFLLHALLLLMVKDSYSQENLSESIVSLAEEQARDEADQEAVSEYIERLHELNEDPVALDSADESSLARLFFLTGFQIRALADYIHSTGKILSVYEIANIPGFNRELADMIAPFIRLESTVARTEISKARGHTLLANFIAKHRQAEQQAGPGHKILLKYKYTCRGVMAGLIAEKDNGERYLSGYPLQPDFVSAHLAWNGQGIIRKLIIGDYSAKFGMGSAINTGLRTGLSLTSPGSLSGIDEIRPYTSTNENNFFRGSAAMLRYKKLALSLFYSANKIDASIKPAEGNQSCCIESFYTSGIHNNITSLAKKDVVTEFSRGAAFSLNFENVTLGLVWITTGFSLPVRKTFKDPADLYDFEGLFSHTGAVYYRASLGRSLLSGEFSSDNRGRFGLVQGISMRPSDRFSLNLLYRNYDPGFSPFHGLGPFSTSSGGNINGIYANFTFEAARHLFLSAGYDMRNYPWLRYRCSAPSRGAVSELRLKYLPSQALTAEAIYGYRKSVADIPGSTGIKKQRESTARSLKGSLKYSPAENLTLISRIGFIKAEPSGSRGMFLMQDVNWKFIRIPVSIWLRYCIFNTDDWESRLYVYENDLLHSFSIPALSGKGKRAYLMLAWKFPEHGDIRIKYAVTEFEQAKSDVKPSGEIKIQCRLLF